jgi:HD-GYP domain-containing protein (c-di-GMP phosphodiesterase class II)
MITEPVLSSLTRLDHFLEIQRRVSGERNIDRLAELVMGEVTALLGVERSSLFLFDWDTMELRARVAEGVTGRALVVPLRMGIVGTAILRREVANVTNAYASPYFNPEIDSVLGYRTDSLLVVPLLASDGRVLGGIEMLNKPSGFFSEDDEQLARETAQRLARWVERGDYYPAAIEAEAISLRNTLGCDRGSVFMIEDRTSRLVSLHADGDSGRSISLNMKLGIAGLCAVTGNGLRITEAWEDPRFDRSVDQRTGFRTRSLLAVPLKTVSGEAIGVVEAINKRDGEFTEADQQVLEAVAGIVSVAIENAMLLADQERQFQSMLDALAASIDARDPLTAGHSHQVADYAVAIGAELGYEHADLDVLRVAATLCDYGMIGIDDGIYKKEGRLTADEFGSVKGHVALTDNILERIHFTRKYRKVPIIAAAHHERIDGKGYPRGLRGNAIPFMAKILSVADVFEALISERHHRGSRSRDEALAILDAGVGTRFDAGVVAALHAHLDKCRADDVAGAAAP